MDKLEEFKKIINESNNIVFFGGAGVSTASGIPDFRGDKGLYNYSPEEIISHSFFMSHPKEFYDFYSTKMLYPDAKPNASHIFLAWLEKQGKLKGIVTQNIDSLHEDAGSKNVIKIHGSVSDNYCMKCGKYYNLKDLDFTKSYHCSCGGIIKPDVVLYEEALKEDDIVKAIRLISNAETLIVAGTSLVVYPAASFINYFKGKHLIIINKNVTNYDNKADLVIQDDLTKYLNIKNFI